MTMKTYAFLYALFISNSLSLDINITRFDHHPGLYFEGMGNLNLVTYRWHLITYFNIGEFWSKATELRTQIDALHVLCDNRECDVVEKTIWNRIKKIFHFNELIKKECNFRKVNRSSILTRNRRSPLDVIGNIANSLFGVLGSDYAAKMDTVIDGLKKGENHALALIRNHTSILEATTSLIFKNFNQIKTSYNFTTEALLKVQHDTRNNGKRISFNTMAHFMDMELNKYESTQKALHDAILQLKKGDINPSLISTEEIENQLVKIDSHLNHGFKLPSIYWEEIEEIIDVAVVFTDSRLVFIIQIPLYDKDMFELYRMLPLATTIGHDYSFVIPEDDYIAVNGVTQEYYLLSQAEINNCKLSQGKYTCYRHHPSYSIGEVEVNNCEMSLFLHMNKHPNPCQLRIASRDYYWIQLHQENTWLFSVKTRITARLVCGSKVDSRQIHGEGILKIPPHCSVTIGTTTIPGITVFSSELFLKAETSFIPKVNISATSLDKEESKGTVLTLADPTSIIDKLKATKANEVKEVDDFIPKLDAHNYVTYFCIVIIILALIVLSICKCSPQNNSSKALDMAYSK